MREVERKRLGIKQSNFKDICAKSINSGKYSHRHEFC